MCSLSMEVYIVVHNVIFRVKDIDVLEGILSMSMKEKDILVLNAIFKAKDKVGLKNILSMSMKELDIPVCNVITRLQHLEFL